MTSPEYKFGEWYDISSAPKDGRKVDLLYPYPRGRTVDCYWAQNDLADLKFGWIWRTPIWKDGQLLPEGQWNVNCYGGDPTHWMPAPALPPPPSSSSTTETLKRE